MALPPNVAATLVAAVAIPANGPSRSERTLRDGPRQRRPCALEILRADVDELNAAHGTLQRRKGRPPKEPPSPSLTTRDRGPERDQNVNVELGVGIGGGAFGAAAGFFAAALRLEPPFLAAAFFFLAVFFGADFIFPDFLAAFF